MPDGMAPDGMIAERDIPAASPPLMLLCRHLAAAWRFRWPAILACWLVCGAGWLALRAIPDQYEASARLYVESDTELSPLLRGLAADSPQQAQLDLLPRRLLSRPGLERLIAATGQDRAVPDPAAREALVARLAVEIRLVSQARNLFAIAYRDTSPQRAHDVVRAMLDAFIAAWGEDRRAQMETARRFLRQQAEAHAALLHAAEQARDEFRARHLDLLPDETGATRLDRVRPRLRALREQLAEQQAVRARLAHDLAATPPRIAAEPDPAAQDDPQLAAARVELATLRQRDTERHPAVIAARRRLAALTALAASRPGRMQPNPVHDQLRLKLYETDQTLAALARQAEDTQAERDRLEAVSRAAPTAQAEYLTLVRDYDLLRRNHDELLARREALRIAQAAETDAGQAGIRVIDPPLVPHNPVGPRRALLTWGVLAAGLLACAGTAMLLGQLEPTLTGMGLAGMGRLRPPGRLFIPGATPAPRAHFGSVALVLAALLPLGAIHGALLLRIGLVAGSG